MSANSGPAAVHYSANRPPDFFIIHVSLFSPPSRASLLRKRPAVVPFFRFLNPQGTAPPASAPGAPHPLASAPDRRLGPKISGGTTNFVSEPIRFVNKKTGGLPG